MILSWIAALDANDQASEVNAADIPEEPVVSINSLNLGRQKILIAEDMEMNVILLKSMLAKLAPEAEICIAENGAKAIQKFFERNPDIVLMDIQMPIFDGISATSDIRALASEAQRKIPIIALTAGITADERENCRLAGMNDFLAKPLSTTELAATLQKYLKPKAVTRPISGTG